MSDLRTRKSASATESGTSGSVVHFLDFAGDDDALLAALVTDAPGATRALYERYANHVQRVVVRIMGVDDEVPDMISETFLQAYRSIRSVKNASSLKAWLSRVAVFTVRGRIRQRRRKRWLTLLSSVELQDVRHIAEDRDGQEALHVLYAILNELPVDERIVFVFRFVDDMGFTEIGEICGVSRATLNRRLTRAQERFLAMARGEPLLAEWIEKGTRWQV